MDWVQGIQKAIDYVEEHITETIDYEAAAKCAFSSAFHFQRVFSILCGYTLGDYIRMRRLTLAGTELVNSGKKVIDAALKYGYDTPESFSRAFVRFHGITPMQAKNGGSLKSFSRISVKLTLDGGNTMNYRIETLQPFQVICKKKQVPRPEIVEPTAEISRFWAECTKDGTIEKLCSYIPKDNIFKNSIVGICFTGARSDKEFPYGIGAHYNGAPITDGDLVVETVPGATYAVFPCKGEMPEAFQKVYKQMYSEFFPASEYKPVCGIEFEAYPSADIKNPDYTCEIWVEVEKNS